MTQQPDATDLELDRIKHAATAIDPVFLHSPQFVDEQLSSALGREVLVKVETDNPLHSFKGRGAAAFAGALEPTDTVVCATAGNFGQAMAYVCRAAGIPVDIFVHELINPAKAERMRGMGARVTPVSGDRQHAAREYAAQRPERVYVQDGKEPRIAEGAGTIGVELLNGTTRFDTLVVPVGDGALINGIGRWLKVHAPHVRLIGVCATGAPAMLHAWRHGAPVARPAESVAAGIAIREPIPESVRRMRGLVDDIVLVDDAALLDAMRLAARTLGTLLEPAGAAGLAAIATHELPGTRTATVLTGGNPRQEHLAEILA